MVQQLNNARIGVSKLCCPVCWDLLSILKNERSKNGQEKGLVVCGRHPTLHEVDLPRWLSLEVLKAMVDQYESKLYEELMGMAKRSEIQSERRSHRRNPSGQSDRSGKSDLSGNLGIQQFRDITRAAISAAQA